MVKIWQTTVKVFSAWGIIVSDFIHVVKRARQFKNIGAVAVLTESTWWISYMRDNFRSWVEVSGWSTENATWSALPSGTPVSFPIPWRTNSISIHKIQCEAYYKIYRYGWMFNSPLSWTKKDGLRYVMMPDE